MHSTSAAGTTGYLTFPSFLSVLAVNPGTGNIVEVALSGATDPDGDPVTLTITGVTQDEALNGLGDGDTAPDAEVGSASNRVRLRAERSGTGDGRVYRIAFTAADPAGATCSGVVTVGVPHDQRPNGAPVDSRAGRELLRSVVPTHLVQQAPPYGGACWRASPPGDGRRCRSLLWNPHQTIEGVVVRQSPHNTTRFPLGSSKREWRGIPGSSTGGKCSRAPAATARACAASKSATLNPNALAWSRCGSLSPRRRMLKRNIESPSPNTHRA